MKIIVNTTHLRTLPEESSRTSILSPTRAFHETHPTAILSASPQQRNKAEIENTNSSNSSLETGNLVPSFSINESWHSVADMAQRRIVLKEIIRCMQKRRPNAPSSMKKILRMMAKKTEEALYKTAPSKEVYADLSTLEHRLEALARRVHVVAMKKI